MSATATPADVIAGRARWCVVCGDSAAVLPSLPPESVNAVVTDPPSGIAFMGAEWDKNKGGRAQWVAWLANILGLARAATKAGGRTFVWSLPRTSHWTGCAVEDAGWSIETTVQHLHGQGWPKGASQLKPAAETWWLARTGPSTALNTEACRVGTTKEVPHSMATRNLADLDCGWGLKAKEDVDGRNPNVGRYPPNAVFSHAAECRREGVRKVLANGQRNFGVVRRSNGIGYGSGAVGVETVKCPGTDPADGLESVDAWTCADGCPVAELAAQPGERRTSGNVSPTRSTAGDFGGRDRFGVTADYGDTGTAARFFPQFPADDPSEPFNAPLFTYVAKPSRAEKNAGCEELPQTEGAKPYNGGAGMPGRTEVDGEWINTDEPRVATGNHHATVKSVALMAWLIRLITKPGDVVLDPFGGSGTTGVAALLEGRRVILIERDPRYVEIACARCEHASPSPERLRTMTSTPVRVKAPEWGALFDGVTP